MTPREIVRNQIRHQETEPVPYTLAFEPEVKERLDQHYGGPAWQDRIVPYLKHCGWIPKNTNVKIDDTHHRDVFGTLWRTDGAEPVVVEPGLSEPRFAGYPFPSVDAFRDPAVKAGVKQRVAEAPDSFTIVGPGLCLWQAWYVRGFEQTMMDCVAEEAFYEELLERFTELAIALIGECADIPTDAIMMGDDWGDQRGVMIGAERWRRFFKPRYARIFDAVHRQGKIAIMHCCGSTADIMGDIVDIGLDVLESVQPEAGGMNPYALKKKWGDQITFWGGLGSQSTIPFAKPEELRREIRRLRSEMSRGGGYILAPAKPLRPETPLANAVTLVDEFLRE